MKAKREEIGLEAAEATLEKRQAELCRRIDADVRSINAELAKRKIKGPWFTVESTTPEPGIILREGESEIGIYTGETWDARPHEKELFAVCNSVYDAISLARTICLPAAEEEYETPQGRIAGMRLVDKEVFEKFNERLCVLKGLIQGLGSVVNDKDKIENAAHGIIGFEKDLDEILSVACELQ